MQVADSLPNLEAARTALPPPKGAIIYRPEFLLSRSRSKEDEFELESRASGLRRHDGADRSGVPRSSSRLKTSTLSMAGHTCSLFAKRKSRLSVVKRGIKSAVTHVLLRPIDALAVQVHRSKRTREDPSDGQASTTVFPSYDRSHFAPSMSLGSVSGVGLPFQRQLRLRRARRKRMLNDMNSDVRSSKSSRIGRVSQGPAFAKTLSP